MMGLGAQSASIAPARHNLRSSRSTLFPASAYGLNMASPCSPHFARAVQTHPTSSNTDCGSHRQQLPGNLGGDIKPSIFHSSPPPIPGRSYSPQSPSSPISYKAEPVDLSHLTYKSYNYLFSPINSDDGTSHDDPMINAYTSPRAASSPLDFLLAKCELSIDNADQEVERINDKQPTKRQCIWWDVPRPAGIPNSLVPSGDTCPTSPIHPSYSPSHPEYRNRLYYKSLTMCEEEDRDFDRVYGRSPFEFRRCRACQNTTTCGHCCAVDNDVWTFREGHRLQSRMATSQSLLLLLESHVRQLRNEGGPAEAMQFISKAQDTLSAHGRLITTTSRVINTINDSTTSTH
jgi:hypothetical protein